MLALWVSGELLTDRLDHNYSIVLTFRPPSASFINLHLLFYFRENACELTAFEPFSCGICIKLFLSLTLQFFNARFYANSVTNSCKKVCVDSYRVNNCETVLN